MILWADRMLTHDSSAPRGVAWGCPHLGYVVRSKKFSLTCLYHSTPPYDLLYLCGFLTSWRLWVTQTSCLANHLKSKNRDFQASFHSIHQRKSWGKPRYKRKTRNKHHFLMGKRGIYLQGRKDWRCHLWRFWYSHSSRLHFTHCPHLLTSLCVL